VVFLIVRWSLLGLHTQWPLSSSGVSVYYSNSTFVITLLLCMREFSQLLLIAGDTSGPTHIISNLGSQISALKSLGFSTDMRRCLDILDTLVLGQHQAVMRDPFVEWHLSLSSFSLFFSLCSYIFGCQPEVDAEWPLRAHYIGWPVAQLPHLPRPQTAYTPSRPSLMPWVRYKTDRSVIAFWNYWGHPIVWPRPHWNPPPKDCSMDPGRTTASSTVPYRYAL